jgi:hypothetical protein
MIYKHNKQVKKKKNPDIKSTIFNVFSRDLLSLDYNRTYLEKYIIDIFLSLKHKLNKKEQLPVIKKNLSNLLLKTRI